MSDLPIIEEAKQKLEILRRKRCLLELAQKIESISKISDKTKSEMINKALADKAFSVYSPFSDAEKHCIKGIPERLHKLSENEINELFTGYAKKYPKMDNWTFGPLPGKPLRGSRRTFCICGRETLRVILIDSELLELHIGFFCPACDKDVIEEYKRKHNCRLWPKPGLGPNVPWNSAGFRGENLVGHWRSKVRR